MELMESWTLLMKQAEHWGLASMPTLNQTGELNAAYWWRRIQLSSSLNASRSSSAAKYPSFHPQSAKVLATRPMSCLTECSRWGVPGLPRKYLLTTTLVASIDQEAGISQSFCSKTICPFSLLMTALRFSQATVSH